MKPHNTVWQPVITPIMMAILGASLVACGGNSQPSQPVAKNQLLATKVAACAAWSNTAVYNGGQCVSYNGKNYQAKWWTQGSVPGSDQWGPRGNCSM